MGCCTSTRTPIKRKQSKKDLKNNNKEDVFNNVNVNIDKRLNRSTSEMFIEPPMLSKEKNSLKLTPFQFRSMDKSVENLYKDLGANGLNDVEIYKENSRKMECSNYSQNEMPPMKNETLCEEFEEECMTFTESENENIEISPDISSEETLEDELLSRIDLTESQQEHIEIFPMVDQPVVTRLVKRRNTTRKRTFLAPALTEHMLRGPSRTI